MYHSLIYLLHLLKISSKLWISRRCFQLPKNQYYFYSLFIISNFKTYAILVISRYLSYVLIFFLLHNTLVTQIILKANNNCLLLNSANAWGRLNFLLYNKKEVLLSNFERHNKQHCQAVSTITTKILLLNTLFGIKGATNCIYKLKPFYCKNYVRNSTQ